MERLKGGPALPLLLALEFSAPNEASAPTTGRLPLKPRAAGCAEGGRPLPLPLLTLLLLLLLPAAVELPRTGGAWAVPGAGDHAGSAAYEGCVVGVSYPCGGWLWIEHAVPCWDGGGGACCTPAVVCCAGKRASSDPGFKCGCFSRCGCCLVPPPPAPTTGTVLEAISGPRWWAGVSGWPPAGPFESRR